MADAVKNQPAQQFPPKGQFRTEYWVYPNPADPKTWICSYTDIRRNVGVVEVFTSRQLLAFLRTRGEAETLMQFGPGRCIA